MLFELFVSRRDVSSAVNTKPGVTPEVYTSLLAHRRLAFW
jgi:hypothetical protein